MKGRTGAGVQGVAARIIQFGANFSFDPDRRSPATLLNISTAQRGLFLASGGFATPRCHGAPLLMSCIE